MFPHMLLTLIAAISFLNPLALFTKKLQPSNFCNKSSKISPNIQILPRLTEMGVADTNPATSPELQSIHRVASNQHRGPSLHLLDDTREPRVKYLSLCVPLHKAALKGDWKAARYILEQDWTLLNSAITKGWETILHVAAGANHVHFVDELVKLLENNDLELQDYKGNTALCFAAAVGNVRVAEIVCNRNPVLPTIRGGEGMTPLHMAALQGRSEMAWYLYFKTIEVFEEQDWNFLFFICINTGLYGQMIVEGFSDLALQMEKQRPMLALARDGDLTGLHILARKPSGYGCQSQGYPKQLMNCCMKRTLVIQLVSRLWKTILSTLDDSEMMKTIREPSQVIFIAAEVGNFEFLAEILSSYPDLIWELNSRSQSIIHIAVLHRHANIFNLVHEIGPIKDFILTFVADDNKDNLLHCAARLAPPDRLDLVSGAPFQMMLELLWFEEVKKIMAPIYIEMPNSEGLTPRQLFTKEHKELLGQAESWMKGTANSCMVVSTLITTGVFSAAFSIPGGNNDNTGTPNYLEKPSFLIFAISDTTALISSSTSILIFLSILISRYAEDDFLRSLPLKLISGLVTLFISIISMMVAFSSSFFIAYYHGLKWVPNFISVLAFLPIPVFAFLQFRLLSDIVYSTYFCRSLFRPSRHMLY